MGFYRIALLPGTTSVIFATMQSLGMPVIRTEERENGLWYYYQDIKSGKEYAFWTTDTDGVEYWCCGLGRSSMQIAKALSAAGVFAKN